MSLNRTFLFVPGSKDSWFNNLPGYGADNIILDLEDSVDNNNKDKARENVADVISYLANKEQNVYVRINKDFINYNQSDIEKVIQPGLQGLVLPKVEDPKDITNISNQLLEIEKTNKLKLDSIKLIPILETAKSMYLAYEIALKQRVIAITGLTAKDGDVQRAINYQWSEKGLETLYIRSKIVLAARAANVIPIGGLWQDVHNIEGLKKNASFNRQIGFDGELILHPSNIPVVNDIYSPTMEEIKYYQEMIEAFNESKKLGKNSVMYQGNHIDSAHIKTARDILDYADSIKNSRKEV